MNYFTRIQRAIDYIEANLCRPLPLQDVAEQAYCSLFHFHRVFQAMVGSTVSDYIRKRRLSVAAQDLVQTKRRVLDVALDYQYETQESFTRAFKRQFGLTPGKLRRSAVRIDLFEPVCLLEDFYKKMHGGILMEPRIVERGEMKIIGVELRTSDENEQNRREIPKFWEKFLEERTYERIPNKVEPNVNYGICAKFDGQANFSYIIGYEVSSFDNVPEGMISHTIPAAKYAVFTSVGPVPKSVQDTWQYIYGTWLPNSQYQRTDTEDFEAYEFGRCNKEKPEVDIYIPIK